MAVKKYSLKTDGNRFIAPNFQIKEFASRDGSDEILIDFDLVIVLQAIREHFGRPVNLTSGYRSPAHDKAVGGTGAGYHTKGMAADITVNGIDPLVIGLYTAELLGTAGGIEIGDGYLHIDVRSDRWRAYTKSGGSAYTTVTDFGYKLRRDL